VLLPAAVAGGAVLATDALIGGLALLAAGIEIAEGEVFATTWADAVSARWPSASGLAHALAPRAGPALTHDPLGLLFSAIACGLGMAWLVGGALRLERRVRGTVLALALVVLAVIPTSIVMTVGRLSGTPRVQSAWAAAAWPGTDEARPALRDAWSVSFGKDPPGLALPPAPSPAARALARLLGALGVGDPRVLGLLALGGVAVLMARAGPRETALERLASSVALPPAILGVVFGSGALVLLALALAAGQAVARYLRIPAASALAGAFVLTATFAAAATAPILGPGLGLSNLRLYVGAAPGPASFASAALVAMVAVAAVVLARRASIEGPRLLAAAATFVMLALWVAPSAEPNDVIVPIAVLVIAMMHDRRDGFDTPEGAP
jgi:hypothetical protein